MFSRPATHAGSWYASDASKLSVNLDAYLISNLSSIGMFGADAVVDAHALISPHAGYTHCGMTAGVAYAAFACTNRPLSRLILLGPSHKFSLKGCAISSAKEYTTPLGKVPVDHPSVSSLSSAEGFRLLTRAEDEAEHSLEMQMPLLVRALQWRWKAQQEGKVVSVSFFMTATRPPHDAPIDPLITILPILVGRERDFGENASKLLPYFSTPSTFCIISSDFCHYGSRFDYCPAFPAAATTPSARSYRIISEARGVNTGIENLDARGMMLIEAASASAASGGSFGTDNSGNSSSASGSCSSSSSSLASSSTTCDGGRGFERYLAETGNTICGRSPILLYLKIHQLLRASSKLASFPGSFKFLAYDQSSKVVHAGDSSVSYAAAVSCGVFA